VTDSSDVLQSAPQAVDRLRAALDESVRRRLAPPPRLVVSAWADRYRVLSRESSAEPGRWRTDRAPYQRGILDAFSDPSIERIVVMSSAQIGKTEILNTLLAFFMAQDPAPILVLQPTLEMAEAWSKDRLAPMLRDTPRLRGLVADARTRNAGNTLLHKEFPGGRITIAGANSPASLASRPIRIVLADEVDRYPSSVGTEGDPIALAFKRTANFWNRKLLMTSTPTLKGMSRIEAAWMESDQRRYLVPCPDCAFLQAFEWKQLLFDEGEEPMYVCIGCGVMIPEERRLEMLRGGDWVAHNPGSRIAGFHINALYSPWARWPDLVAEWKQAQTSVTLLQAFVNLALGESWEDRGGGLDPESLFANRREAYAGVPSTCAMLTAGVDVQANRLEMVVRGWGASEESWLVDRVILLGDPSGPEVWADLDRALLHEYPCESGGVMRIHTACIDSGHEQIAVLRFCGPRYRRRVYAVKGGSNHAAPFLPKRPSVNNKLRCPLFLLGTTAAKGTIYGRLKIQGAPVAAETRAAYKYHFSEAHCDRDYFEQLTAAKAVKQQLARLWTVVYETPPHKRDEVLDCEVYALAALYLSNVPREQLGAAAERRAAPTAHEPAEEPRTEALTEQDLPTPPAPRKRQWQPRSGSGFVKRPLGR
jgi:phage terminase large subunit GpA-like protein